MSRSSRWKQLASLVIAGTACIQNYACAVVVTPFDAGSSVVASPSSAASWNPVVDFDDLFPSFIFATTTFKPPKTPPPNYLGNPLGQIGLEVRTTVPNTKVQGKIEIDQIAEPTTFSYTLPEPGQYKIYPAINYRFQQLTAIRQPITVNINTTFSIDDAAPETRTQPLRVRSINDALIATKLPNGQVANLSWALASYVNENHPAIDSVLREALNLPVPIVREFVGYQQGPQEVLNQVFAIWYLFQRRGFTYSSITTPTGASNKVYSQYVRFFGDSLRTQQANCIDGTVLFASILRRIGIDPIVVLVPGHAYLGFWLDQQHREPAFLETTALNSPENPYRNQKPSKFRDAMARAFQADFKLQRASDSFNHALAIAGDNFSKSQGAFRAHTPGYQMLDIDKIRQLGIQPINR